MPNGENGESRLLAPSLSRDSNVPAEINELYRTTTGSKPSGSQEHKRTGPIVIAVGGMGSTPNDAFFKMIRGVHPDSIQIPLKDRKLSEAKDLLQKYLDEAGDENVIVVGHSLGASLAKNLSAKEGPNTKHNFMYLDPPYETPWQYAPEGMRNLAPVSREIDDAIENGIKYDPGIIDWTKGRAVMYGPNAAHTPWSDPKYPGNQNRIDTMLGTLRKLIGIPQFSAPPRPSALTNQAATVLIP